MGSSGNYARALADAHALATQWELARTEEDAALRERALASANALLGTPEQIAGDLGPAVDPKLLEYSKTLEFNADVLTTASTVKDPIYFGSLVTEPANEYMRQAREAYLAGDTQRAEELHRLAVETPSQVITTWWQPKWGDQRAIAARSFAWVQGEAYQDALTRQMVQGATAQTVGQIVAEAKELGTEDSARERELRGELQDPASEALREGSARARRDLTLGRSQALAEITGAERAARASITANEELARRQVVSERAAAEAKLRQRGLAHGVGRSQTAEAALYGRFADLEARASADIGSRATAEREKFSAAAASERASAVTDYATAQAELEASTGSQLASLFQQTEQFFQSYRSELRMKGPLVAQAFLQNQPGVRDSYINQVHSLRMGAADLGKSLVTLYAQHAQNVHEAAMVKMQIKAKERMQKSAQNAAMLNAAIEGLFTVVGAAAGGPIGAAIGSWLGGMATTATPKTIAV